MNHVIQLSCIENLYSFKKELMTIELDLSKKYQLCYYGSGFWGIHITEYVDHEEVEHCLTLEGIFLNEAQKFILFTSARNIHVDFVDSSENALEFIKELSSFMGNLRESLGFITLKDLIRNKDYDYISIRYTPPEGYDKNDPDLINKSEFMGCAYSKDGHVYALDHDTYSEDEEVIAYEEFTDEKEGIHCGLTIVIPVEWSCSKNTAITMN